MRQPRHLDGGPDLKEDGVTNQRITQERDQAVGTRRDRQAFWTAVARGTGQFATASLQDRLTASELLGRSQADFVARHEVTGALVLEPPAVTA